MKSLQKHVKTRLHNSLLCLFFLTKKSQGTITKTMIQKHDVKWDFKFYPENFKDKTIRTFCITLFELLFLSARQTRLTVPISSCRIMRRWMSHTCKKNDQRKCKLTIYRRNAVVVKLIEVEGSLDSNLKGNNREE